MADPFSNEALRGTLNTQAEIYANIRNKALEEAANVVSKYFINWRVSGYKDLRQASGELQEQV